jgi:ABC-type multidrug transport system ATPase subunit
MPSAKLNIVIELFKVSKRYRGKGGIIAVSGAFQNDRLHLLVGANGSGKSTLLKCIMGLVRFEGEIKKKHFRIGYAPEEYIMPYYMSVRDFLMSIGKMRDSTVEGLEQEVDSHLEYFGLRGQEKMAIGKLSNGMRQKVNLIQAFLHHPKILLLDEPLHALDEDSQTRTIGLIKDRLTESLIIVSTHDPEKFKVRHRQLWKMTAGQLGEVPHA